jgi:8-oxo-dGTP diphosphatase
MLVDLVGKFWKAIPRGLRAFLTRRIQWTFTSSAAGIITNERGEILLLNHVLRPVSGWGVAGGFLEKGEQAEAALIREIKEETGLDITDVKLYRVRTIRRHIEVVFLAKAEGEPQVLSREITEARWFGIDDIPKEMNLQQHFMIRRALGHDD